ncbi:MULTISPECIES: DUF5119 domain-containing protein [Phocaeicola]|jgi:hypothetical protein|nr:DUF5119 domain-containing protein [Phocaeicola vulgatus]
MRMRSVFRWIWIVVLPILFASCEHKELCLEHTHSRRLRVGFDWSRLAGHGKPEGMRVIFFPVDGTGEPWIFDFPCGEERPIELPENDYGVICYNYDADGIVWENENSYAEFTAATRNVLSPDGGQAHTTPSWLCGDYIDQVRLKDIPAGTEQVITLFPAGRVCRYTYEVNGIRRIERVADIRASLSDMVGALIMVGDRLPDGLSESLLFGGAVAGEKVCGAFYTFGCCQGSAAPNVFRLYIRNRSGKTFVLEQDVSEQIHSVPVSGHVGDVHIVINLDFEVPDDSGDGGNTGFDVDVDDWADVTEDIIC